VSKAGIKSGIEKIESEPGRRSAAKLLTR